MHLTRHNTSNGPRWALDGQYLPSEISLGLLLELPEVENNVWELIQYSAYNSIPQSSPPQSYKIDRKAVDRHCAKLARAPRADSGRISGY